MAVPETIMLGKLHDVIHATMGWCDCQLHEFEIAGERYGFPIQSSIEAIPSAPNVASFWSPP